MAKSQIKNQTKEVRKKTANVLNKSGSGLFIFFMFVGAILSCVSVYLSGNILCGILGFIFFFVGAGGLFE